MITPARTFYKKALLLSGFTLFCTLFIVGRLFQLQIYYEQGFSAQSQKNFLRYEKTKSLRGNILDSFGKIIATNNPVTTLFWKGTGNNQLTESQLKIIDHIEFLTGHILQDRIKDFTKSELV